MDNPDMANLSVEQRRLMAGWRDVLEDLRHLCRSLKVLPDHCACGDGQSHLTGSCVCCQTQRTDRVPACENCDGLLAELRPEMNTLTVDTWRFFPVVMDLLKPRQRGITQAETSALERHVTSVSRQAAADAVERHIAAVIQTFERLVVAAEEFRAGCRMSHLRTLKTAATDLLAEVEGLDRAL
jgi:hypothetical protein